MTSAYTNGTAKFMRRFANPNLTVDLSLGPCQCPEQPHDEDIAVLRAELGAGEEGRVGAYGWSAANMQYFDWEAARSKLIEIGVVRWNLRDDDGPVPVNVTTAGLLDEATRDLICNRLNELTGSKPGTEEPPPNRRGARSRRTSRTSASRTTS
jgi:hypothetical protein